MVNNCIKFNVESWAAWAPGLSTEGDWQQWFTGQQSLDESSKPNIKYIPPILRRRLSYLGKGVGAALNEAAGDACYPTIFCSRHGDLQQTLAMLQELAAEQPLSPTAFSLSVHNAIAGVLSIGRKNTSNFTALAAGEDGVWHAILESVAQLQTSGSDKVLCVIYDAPVPELYADDVPVVPFPHALALLLNRESGTAYSLDFSADDSLSATEMPDQTITIELIRFLLSATQEWSVRGERQCFRLCRS